MAFSYLTLCLCLCQILPLISALPDRSMNNNFLFNKPLSAILGIFGKVPKNNNVSPKTVSTNGYYDSQSTWNSIFDIGKYMVLDQMIGNNNNIFAIPRMRVNFDQWKIHGHINLRNITVKGLASLDRYKDFVVRRFKNRYDLSTGLQLKDFKMKIAHYKGKYGMIEMGGSFGVTIRKIALSLKASVDYNRRPCKIEVKFKKDVLKDPKIEFTGLGIMLNWPVRKFAEHFINNHLFEFLKHVIDKQTDRMNCEKFRSAFESVNF